MISHVKIVTVAAGQGSRLSAHFINSSDINQVPPPKAIYPVMGKPMIYWSLQSFHHWLTLGVIELKDLTFVVQNKHETSHKISDTLFSLFGTNITIKMIDGLTRGPAETALNGLSAIPLNEEIIINDCDHNFSSDSFLETIKLLSNAKKGEEYLAIATVETLPGLPSWSYAEMEEGPNSIYGRVLNIKEKDPFLASIGAPGVIGSYYFSSKKLFDKLYKKSFQNHNGEFYISRMFEVALQSGLDVFACHSKYGYPLGTPEEIQFFETEYFGKPLQNLGMTLFFDIDGVLVDHDAGFHSNMHRYDYKKQIIGANVEMLRKHYLLGDTIILTTSRPSSEETRLKEFLKANNIPFTHLILGINPGIRVIYNDRKPKFFSIDTAVALSNVRNQEIQSNDFVKSLSSKFLENLTSGSGAETSRLIDSYGNTFIRKCVPHSNEFAKESKILEIQYEWFNDVSRIIPDSVPKVKYYGLIDNIYCLDMQDLGRIPKLSDVIHYGQVDERLLEKMMSDLVKNLDAIYTQNASLQLDNNWVQTDIIISIILNKALPAIEALFSTQFAKSIFQSSEFLTINNKIYKNPALMLKKIIENPTWLKDHKINLGAKYLTLIHGDLTLENILVGNDDKLKFIDPLSAMMDPSAFINFNLERTKTSPVFDLIKLLQSIDVGYEVWSKMQNVAGVDVNANISFRSELITSSSKVRETIIDYYSTLGVNVNQVNLNFLLALQLFRIIPYKLQAEIDKAWYCFAVATTLIDGIN